ncbi:MAG TPA: hypothetical protein VJ180_08520 [Pyrinomonadaceae bacterium]|nr:hypothetical protein [Pyrinomonadaceae bacterium]
MKTENHKQTKPSSVHEVGEHLARRMDHFTSDNADVKKALDLFNISEQHYETSVNALQITKTYVTTSTLLPGQHG